MDVQPEHEGEAEHSGELPVLPEEPISVTLTSLPPSVLWLIARKMGRRSRVVSRALLAAYGPLDCRLVLSGRTALDELQLLLEHSAQHLQHVTSLQLPRRGSPCSAELLSAIAAALPGLQSLSLQLHSDGLQLLSPLGRSLTALDIVMHSAPGASTATSEDQVPLRLPNLKLLAVGGTLPRSGDSLAWAFLLSGWQHLEHLSWFADCSLPFMPTWTPELLEMLPGTQQKTCLSLGYSAATQTGWQVADTAAMQRVLRGVRSLSLKEHAYDAASIAGIEAMVEGLSRCRGLDAVHLKLLIIHWHPALNLLHLASLHLASLRLSMVNTVSGAEVEPLLHALHALSHLTKLELSFFDLVSFYLDLPQQLPASLVDLQVGGAWHPSSLLPPLQALPALRVLGLNLQSREWPDDVAEQLSTLTQLRTLSLKTCLLPPGWVAALACLTALQELRMGNTMQGSATDEDLLQLAQLRALTCLSLSEAGQVTADGFLGLLEALPNLQQLELGAVDGCGVDVEALVEGVLPDVLPRLTCLKLVDAQLPGHVRDVLLSAAEAHGCRCHLV